MLANTNLLSFRVHGLFGIIDLQALQTAPRSLTFDTTCAEHLFGRSTVHGVERSEESVHPANPTWFPAGTQQLGKHKNLYHSQDCRGIYP